MQNSFISYEVLHKLRIPQPIQFLQSRYPEGMPLVTTFVHPSMIEMLDAATEDALERSSWIDSLSILPMSFGSQDASKLLSLCPSIQQGLKSDKAKIFGESYVFSNGFIKDVYDRLEKEMETFNVSGASGTVVSGASGTVVSDALRETKAGHDASRLTESTENVSDSSSNKQAMEKGSKKKKGKGAGTMITGPAESELDNQDRAPMKSKKNQRKGKNISSEQVAESKAAAKLVKIKEENLNIPSEDWVMKKIATLVPDFEEQGLDDPQTILRPLANYLRPMLINSWKERRKALFSENAERMKQLLDSLQKKFDESFLNMQLYEKALDLFEDDQSTSVILHRHLLRTTATAIVDMLLQNLDKHNKLKNGDEVAEPQISESISLTPGERTSIAKTFPGSLSNKALTVVEALEGKRVETFMTALRDIAEESGLLLKKLDKKLERTLLHAYQKDLVSQVSAEMDPVSLLAKVVSLIYVQVHHKALQAPGRAIAVAVSRLKDKLDDSAHKILTDYQTTTVTLLALISAPSGDGEDCTSDRILSKRELLENQMTALKGLVLGTSKP
ncbi:E3 UFM1-protein ligase 1 homolog isoform X1 [Prunus yedoensis var. nudiflora]|uniref:E3 UFM1-protein ligase 1 homolog isoform X1 n=1 Tax=Prunus yedoensis var. nudiflora TaxID=2094558 RepID=A0A314YXV1_PRUYE|nr:E3 UFM1-protein ligase 1 homolog isoform X1 [Prunus yedoensis var. nudiflora]